MSIRTLVTISCVFAVGCIFGEAQAHIRRADWGWYWSVGRSHGEWEAVVIYDDQCPLFGKKCGFFSTFLQHRT
jgi:hypothetical protein